VEANKSTGRGTDKAIEVREIAGAGLEATLDGRRVRIGSPAFVAGLTGLQLPRELVFVADPMVVTALGDESGWLALFTFSDPIRSDARALIAGLRARGIAVSLLTGDRPAVARCVAQALGIDEWRAGFSPGDKAAYVRALQDRGATVAAVGDGVNDAPVMAQAHVSIAMGGGTDLAQSHADVILAAGRVGAITELFEAAVRSRRVIRQNLTWAVVYNAVALPLAVFGLASPLLAAIGMSASSVMVVLNGLRAAHPAAAQPMPRVLTHSRSRADHSPA
jgi:Cu2+-exporting ATPase